MEIEKINAIVFVDGECLLCNRLVNALLRVDRKKRLKFMSIQSPDAQEFLAGFGKDQDLSTVVFYHQNSLYTKSEAILMIFRLLPPPIRWLWVFHFLPRRWLNTLYDYVAKNRFKWFGKSAACPVPYEGLDERIL